ncbi:hypothetical protein [Rugosimonospora africana]|uniref:Uncharacterized protein n=1 Tax=Rugosimonospora africana TaxID=556532 RepID=A0A8J3QMR9_9ACTN|nr:hypothetical protein [Rugosimonospora africana]GIH11916.1 hypothetical protein Raf01_00880 [Rugosimonospora africana]
MSVHHTRAIFYRGEGRSYQRTYGVRLDGEVVALLERNETRSVPISPGYHVAQAFVKGGRGTLVGSRRLEFQAPEGSGVRIRVEYAGSFLIGLWRAFTTNRWLRLVVETEGVDHHEQPGAIAAAVLRRRARSGQRRERRQEGPIRPF